MQERVAVFVTHGMGQQTKFQTTVQVADALRRAEADAHGVAIGKVKPARARTVKLGSRTVQRLELDLKGKRVDVYEGYWAPLTEGAITAKGVVDYLRGAGWNGLRTFVRGYARPMFGSAQHFHIEGATAVYLLLALVVLYALLFINSTVVLVAAQKANFTKMPWLTDSLGMLTAGAGVFCTIAIAYALASIAAGVLKSRLDQLPAPHHVAPAGVARPIRALLTMAFFAVVISVVLIAASMAFSMIGRWDAIEKWRYSHFGEAVRTASVNGMTGFTAVAVAFSATAAVWTLLSSIFLARRARGLLWILKIATCAIAAWWLYEALFLFLSIFYDGMGYVPLFRVPLPDAMRLKTFSYVRWLWLWAVLLYLSAKIKDVIVQYPGDVAIYVGSHRMDRYDKIRDAIREKTYEVASALFSAKSDQHFKYDRILFAGHSLGSVVVYDTINRVLLEDELAQRPLRAADRIGGLVTFGSPLDKTAYLFSLQRREGSDGQEALSTSLQPLIQSYGFRKFEWVNVHSMLDIISGGLTFYDSGNGPVASQVRNVPDEEALVPITHHTHYWQGRTVWRELHAMI